MEESSGSNIMMKPMTSNYSIWKPRMEDMLFFHDLEGVILGDSAKPSIMIDKKRKKLNRKTVSRIRQWVDNRVFNHVAYETNAHVLWNALQEMYERKTTQNKTFLFRKLINLKYNDGTPITEHLNTYQ
ncbi:hypothetical protein VitviT2T_005393 [Vitis vinifera]|uniref:DUF4219 domain-containing protein n=1 Tax=Vitis vinifera TaxID=29760 RepID=A0ABY9BT61_VITVI|nr:hypothetical protein VitviT2T_005393 [Vitis vinifera]